MTQEQYNRAIEIGKRISNLQEAKNILSRFSRPSLNFVYHNNVSYQDDICDKMLKYKIGDILNRHTKMVINEIDEEIKKLKEEINKI